MTNNNSTPPPTQEENEKTISVFDIPKAAEEPPKAAQEPPKSAQEPPKPKAYSKPDFVQSPYYKRQKERQSSNNRDGLIISITSVLAIMILSAALMLFIRNSNNKDDTSSSSSPSMAADINASDADLDTPVIWQDDTPEPTFAHQLDTAHIYQLINNYAPSATVSVYIYDLRTNQSYATDYTGSKLSASALINIPILFTVAHKLSTGELNMATQTRFTHSLSGRGSIPKERSGEYMTVSDLLDAMLFYSDNNAANSLINLLENDINTVCADYGFTSVGLVEYIGYTTDARDNFISPKDLTGMLQILWNNELAIGRDYLMSHMMIMDSIARIGLGRDIPASKAFMNHNATKEQKYNEVSIVTSGSGTYFCTFMGNYANYQTLASLAGDIGSYIDMSLQGGAQ